MVMLSLKNIEKFFGQRVLFKDACFEVYEGDRIGLIGANGAGKTTLFKMITGDMAIDGGEMHTHKLLKTAYLEQQSTISGENTLYAETLSVFEPLMAMEQEMERVRADIEHQNGELEALVRRQHFLHTEYEQQGGLMYQSRTRAVLLGLGFAEADFDLPLAALSGGQRTRAMLGRVLLSDANLLLLDEPTNHLDIAAVEWLEGFLKTCKAAVLVISHDRYFLDRVTKRTLELENTRLTAYEGNYSAYVKKKAEDQLALTRSYENTQKEIARLERIIEQQKRWNRERNLVTAGSKQKVIDKLAKDMVRPDKAPEAIRFSLSHRERGGNEVLTVRDLAKSFDGKPLFEGISLLIKKSERVFLLGPNGCGKTTLFKIITGQTEASAGETRLGANIKIGYYDQMQTGLSTDNTAMEEIAAAYPQMTQTQIRNALGAFLFRGDDVFKNIGDLSGGEQARVSLLKLMMSQANFLLLDEPTNHLDIASREALEEALDNYGGTLFVISHDRYFINKLADRIVSFLPEGGGLKETGGNYDDYLESMAQDAAAAAQEKAAQPQKTSEYRQKKETEAAKRRLAGQIARAEQGILDNEEKIAAIKAEAEQPENASDYEKLMRLHADIDSLEHKNAALLESWERLSGELLETEQ
jgi:ATP-binding cassette subfamily F protein 3